MSTRKQYVQSIFEAREEATATRQYDVIVEMNMHLCHTQPHQHVTTILKSVSSTNLFYPNKTC